MTRACTPALLRTTEESPTARAISPSQVREYLHVFVYIFNTENIYSFLVSFSLEATSITEPPEDSEVMVGDEVILRCAASYDPMLDITYIWAIDFRVIDFDAEWEHYERIMVG